MKKKLKKKFRIILFLSPVLIFLTVFTILLVTKDKPPVEEIQNARVKLSEAKAVNAHKYSKKLFANATSAYDSAMLNWKIENEKFFLFRKYDKVRYFANQSEKYASSSIDQADSNSKNLNQEIAQKINKIQLKVDIYQANFENIPQIDDIRKQYNKGKIYFSEAKLAYQKSDLIKAEQKIDLASKLIEKSYSQANNILTEYFKNYPKWQKWVNNTIEQSSDNSSYCIIVDKFARECKLYFKGNLKDTFDADLGKNWIGTKNHQGDYTTPEGIYKVIDKKENGRSRYYKALLINYPNEDDKARFSQNKKNGSISSRKRIGDLIEIHGNGGQGADWTSGCVALANSDIDKLYSRCAVGTTVTIVGSCKPFSEIMKLP
jgi:L,D-peptidoglycan transpeptidase YkuD (ErfK/YbiS/YcfS/YnhG family)